MIINMKPLFITLHDPNYVALRNELLKAKQAETLRMITDRNTVMQNIFNFRRNRKIVFNGKGIETWWDRRSRNWVTYMLDSNGDYDGGDSLYYSGNQGDAAVAHSWALCKLFQIN